MAFNLPGATPAADDPNNYMGTGMSQAAYFAALAAGGQNATAAASSAGNVAASNVTPEQVAADQANPPGPKGAAINQDTPPLDQYGRFTSGPYAGLTQEAARQKVSVALETHGGYSFKPDEYRVNYNDGSITILKTPANGNYALTPGMTVDQSGNVFMPDGSPQISAQTGKQAQLMFGVNGEKTDTMKTSEANTPALTNLLEGNPGEAIGKTATDIASGLGLNTGSGSGGGVNTDAISAAAARSAALSDQFNGQYNNFQGNTAPVAQSQQIQDIINAQQQAPIQAGQASAGLSNAAQINGTSLAAGQAPLTADQIQAAIAAKQQAITAQQVAAAQQGRTALGDTALAGATQLAPAQQAAQTQLGPAALAQGAQIDQSQQAQFRGGQAGLVSGLQGAIAGTDPSVAALMLRQATERNIANQFAQAKAATGMNAGLAERQAMLGSADLNQQAIGQQALLRAQEIATARGQLGGVLDQGRTQDINLASQQAQFGQQAGLANQSALNTAGLQQGQLDTQTRLANAGFVNTANMTQAQLAQALQLANAGFRNTATTTQAQLDAAQSALNTQQANSVGIANQGASLQAGTTNATLAQQAALANQAAQNQAAQANQAASLQAGTTNATLGQQLNLANAGAQNTTAQQNAGLANASNLANAQNLTQTGISNAGNQTSANTASAQLANQVALANAAAGNAAQQTNAQLGTQTSIANAGNQVTTTGQNIAAQNNLAQNALTGSGQAITGTVGAAQAQATAAEAAAKQNAALIGAGATVGAALLSDRRAKTDIANGDAAIAEMLDKLKAHTGRYKDPSEPGAAPGRRAMIMAQDLEKSAMGRALVRDIGGRKAIDVNQATGAALAALAQINARLSKVEAR
jgi:hypothetical protein